MNELHEELSRLGITIKQDKTINPETPWNYVKDCIPNVGDTVIMFDTVTGYSKYVLSFNEGNLTEDLDGIVVYFDTWIKAPECRDILCLK